ncbi:MAG: hypothetical protein KC777_09960 [Cyanobacteria bacterium HKST-UBA02]|nr:hypothetical protein [Cyanobacteria bacterium HKST-UBA02]
MKYIIFVQADEYDDEPESDQSAMYAAEVPAADAKYFKKVIENLKPLSEEDYMTGPAVILHSMARFSYILDNDDVYWCIEWPPGLVVVRFGKNGTMAWTSVRSLVPGFGGRDSDDEDDLPELEDEDENPQYNLVFHPWDAQFDAEELESSNFEPAGDSIRQAYEKAMSRVEELGGIMQERYESEFKDWIEVCQQNLERWTGEGIRV